MKKWDNDKRLCTYVTKILNAKPTIQYNSIKQPNLQVTRETDFSSHASCRSDKSQNIKESILYKQLQEYNLQQHTNQLHLRGYQQGLQLLASQSQEYQNQILEELKLPSGHKQKFVDLFKYLSQHPNAVINNAVFTPTNFNPKKSVQTVPFGKFSNIKDLQSEILRPPIAKKPSQQRFSPVRDGSISKTRQILPKIQQSKSMQRRNSENRNKSKEKSHQSIASQQFQLNNNSRQHTGHTNQVPHEKKKLKKKAQDDIILVTEYHKDKAQTKIKENKLLKNLEKFSNNQECLNVDLHMDQIKLMYQSFEGGHLCSTLINIDIEEICNCVASALQKYLKIHQLNELENDQIEKQNCTIQESPFEQSKINQSQYDDQEFEDGEEEEVLEREESTQREQILQFLNNQLVRQQTQSQFSMESFQGTNDLKEFQKVFIDTSLPNVKPQIEVIQNYCKNIMATTKMEREIAILAMVYIEKLQIEQGIEITCLNWQKILFTALVIASKIWDDESFENNNFAKVLPQFSTVQINEMEKLFLRLIDYNLYIKQGDYAKQYLMLRAFADKKKRSFPLKQLDLKTVMALQKKTEQLIMKSQFNGGLNKSF